MLPAMSSRGREGMSLIFIIVYKADRKSRMTSEIDTKIAILETDDNRSLTDPCFNNCFSTVDHFQMSWKVI